MPSTDRDARLARTHHIRVHALNAAIVVAVGAVVSLVTSTAVASRAYVRRAAEEVAAGRAIRVTGYARERIRADKGEWRITVVGRGPALADAYAVLDAGVDAVRGFLAERGFPEADLDLAPISTTTHMARDERGRQTEDVSSYTLKRAATVRSADVDRIAASAGMVTELLERNIELESAAPQFTVSDIDALKISIAGAASADARRRADAIADESGCAVTDVRDARLGVIQITQPDSTEVRSYGIYDTTTIDKDISVTVTLTLGLSEGA